LVLKAAFTELKNGCYGPVSLETSSFAVQGEKEVLWQRNDGRANAVGVGVLVTLLALWALSHNTQVLKGWHAPCSQPEKM
jgi:hypothetical protein